MINVDTKQTQLQHQHVELPFIDKKQLQLEHKPMQPKSRRHQPVKSKSTRQLKSKISSLPKALLNNDIQQSGLWSPASNESWDYTSMKAEVNRVLQDELQSAVSMTTKQRQDDVNKVNEEQLQQQSAFCQVSKHRNTGNCLKHPILITETYSFSMEVNNVVHPFKKRIRKKGKIATSQTTSKGFQPFKWNGIEFHFNNRRD